MALQSIEGCVPERKILPQLMHGKLFFPKYAIKRFIQKSGLLTEFCVYTEEFVIL